MRIKVASFVWLATFVVITGCGWLASPMRSILPTATPWPTATTPAPIAAITPLGVSPPTAPSAPTSRVVHATATVLPSLAPTVAASVQVEACRGGNHTIVLLIDPRLATGIRANLDQFSTDLCQDGYTVLQRLGSFATAPDARAYLAKLRAQTQPPLIGAIVIGDFPRAYQWVILHSSNPSIPPAQEEALSLQYYADLNGTFEASPNYKSPGKYPYSYDVHSGDLNWEIWVGVLPLYKGDVAKTVEALNRYFTKNHAYRTGTTSLPRAFLQISEHFKSTAPAKDTEFLNAMRSGEYAWTPFSTASHARFYFDAQTPTLALEQGYADLSAGVADFTVQDAHGTYKASGKLTIAWVESKPVQTIFFWSNGCAVGNLDYPDNFLTAALYSPTSAVLVAKGTTNNSGGLGKNQTGFYAANIATALSQKKSLGEAILAHVNVPLVDPYARSREFHYASALFLGDPTLRLR